nr:ribonuclease H-like domain-containing protein [Tanacetum cinerariifolium]
MAALQYKAKHNKVGYLLKPTGSDDYHNIIDFLRSSHIRYALTSNPIIFDSLVKQFWSTATLRAPELSPPAILATIDRTPHTITEDLVRSRLQLADDGGVADLPILEIYYGMDNLGYVTKGKLTFLKKIYINGGEGAKVDAQDVPHPMPTPIQSPSYLPTPSRPQSSDPVPPVLKHEHSFNQHETIAGSFLTREDAPLGGNFHTSPTRSSHAPPTGQPSGGAEDPITLTALSYIVSTLVQKVHSLEAELHDHKKLFKDVVGKLVKKVKTLEVILKTQKRKMVVSNSDQEDDTTQNVDLDALRTLANAAVAVDSDIPSGNTSKILAASPCDPTAVPPYAFGVPHGASAVPDDSLKVSTAVPANSLNIPAGVSNKGKYPMVKEDIPVKARTFRQMEEDRLGEEAAKQLHDEEMAHMERESAKKETTRGDDVFDDNFPPRVAALIKQKRQALAEQLFKERQNQPLTPAQQKAYMRQYVKNQSSAIYNTGWTMAYMISFSDEQLKQEFEKIRKVQSYSQIQAFSCTLKRPGSVLEEPTPKRLKSPEAPTPSMPKVPISPAVTSPPSSRTKQNSLGRKHMHKAKSTLLTLDLDAPARTFLKTHIDSKMLTDVSYPLSIDLIDRVLIIRVLINNNLEKRLSRCI